MESTKMHEVIISTSFRFSNEASVNAYRGIPWDDLPEDDMWYTEVTRYIVGYRRIVLFGATGRRLAVFSRHSVKGMAVDGEPVVISGPDFKRIGVVEAPQDNGYFVGDGTEEDGGAESVTVEDECTEA